jgi:hypothetical protein
MNAKKRKRDIRTRVVLNLPPLDLALLNATTKHTGKTREQVVADALRVLFAALPRPDD